MKELGPWGEQYHREIGQCVAATGAFDLLVCVGPQSVMIAEAAIAAGFPANSVAHYADASVAASAVPMLLGDDDLVLLKASRSVLLEKIANAITARATAA